jgi:hypothetical protein
LEVRGINELQYYDEGLKDKDQKMIPLYRLDKCIN